MEPRRQDWARMHTDRWAETEAALPRTDLAWSSTMMRRDGRDGLLPLSFRQEGRGGEGPPMLRADAPRRHPVALWRHEPRIAH